MAGFDESLHEPSADEEGSANDQDAHAVKGAP
jgi:hypothetical protein